MKRRWNLPIWAGFLVSVGALLGYFLFFARFPVLRDAPWTASLLSLAGVALSAAGLRRAFRQPESYRGKVFGTVLVVLGATFCSLFTVGLYHFARGLPASTGAPRIGARAPDFTLTGQDGKPVTLASLLTSPLNSTVGGAKSPSAVLLIFYRGYW